MKHILLASIVAAATLASNHTFGKHYMQASGYGPTYVTPRVQQAPPSRYYRPR